MEPRNLVALIRRAGAIVLTASLISWTMASLADALADRRSVVGLNLFRTFVSADRDLQRHKNQAGQIPIVILYTQSQGVAKRHQEILVKNFSEVKGFLTLIVSQSLDDFLVSERAPAAVFVAEKLRSDERQRLVNISIQQRFLVFSPFEGDVEGGILGGLSVEARVTPMVNMNTLLASNIPLKDFYLSVSRRYEK